MRCPVRIPFSEAGKILYCTISAVLRVSHIYLDNRCLSLRAASVPVHKLSEKLIFFFKTCLSAHSGRVFLLLAAQAFTSSCHRASTKRCVRALYLCLKRDFSCRITEYARILRVGVWWPA